MRYRDCPAVEVETKVSGDPAAIWSLLTDITLSSRFSSELQEVQWLDGATAVAIGNRFSGRNRNDQRGEWTTECEVVELEPGRRWVWQVNGDEGVMATWGFELDPGRDSATVRHWGRMGPSASGLTAFIATMPDREGRIISGRMSQWRESMTATLEGLKQLIEGPTAGES
ncbi:MAG: SRPBCC family protein [Microthrixaceae bacterium]